MINGREWQEIGKIVSKYQELKKDFIIEVDDTYSTIKEYYFTYYLGMEASIEVPLSIPYDLLDRLYVIADEQNILIDELVINILDKALSSIEEPKNDCNAEEECEDCNNYEPESPQYRMLELGELLDSNTDEQHNFIEWFPLHRDVDGLEYKNPEAKIRRKLNQPKEVINPEPPTYRLLNDGEIIQEGDELYICDEWRTTDDECIGQVFEVETDCPIRRKM